MINKDDLVFFEENGFEVCLEKKKSKLTMHDIERDVFSWGCTR
ncbi:hypothetical protein [Neisseria sp. KEM232]|nr:hypothetical protein [Neisseria sp. KEM232]